jgi:hypothetical protein
MSASARSDIMDIAVELVRETARAVLVHDGDESRAVWLAKSQIEFRPNDPVPGAAIVTLPTWLAREKGLI